MYNFPWHLAGLWKFYPPPVLFFIGRRQSKQRKAHNTIITTQVRNFVALYGTCEISHIVSPHNHRKWILMDCPGEDRQGKSPNKIQDNNNYRQFCYFFFPFHTRMDVMDVVRYRESNGHSSLKGKRAWIIKKTCRKWIKLSTKKKRGGGNFYCSCACE